MPVYEVSTEVARAAVRPADLRDTLESLRASGAIRSFAIEGDVLRVDADQFVEFWLGEEDANERAALDPSARIPEARSIRDVLWEPEPAPQPIGAARRRGRAAARLRAEARSAYYEQALAFVGTSAYRRLSAARRAIWRLHAQGLSEREVAEQLQCSSGAVARALAAMRPLAGLPRVTYVSPKTETE